MTDARLPERWLNDRRLLRLDHSTYRAFITTLLWSVSNRTDGILEPGDLDLVPGARAAVDALVRARLWDTANGTVSIIDFISTQTSSHELEVLENVRRNNREAQARAREKRKAEHKQSDSQPDVNMTGEPDDIGRLGRLGRQGRQGQEDLPEHARENDEERSQEGTDDGWGDVVQPGTARLCRVCSHPLDRITVEDTHPCCDQDELKARRSA